MNDSIVNVTGLKVRIGKKTILKNLEVEFRQGECVLIAGANGAGKSTFLKCLAGVVLPDHGEVNYAGDIGPGQIGFISDRLSLFENFTLQQGIEFHTRVFGIERFDSTLIEDIRFDRTQKIRHLSTGERTLFNLALVWSQEPLVLLIDEVIHVIDPFLRDKFLESVIDLMDRCGTTVFMVNHTFSEIERIPERVLVMADGRFILDEKSEVLAGSLKKVVSSSQTLEEGVPCIFSKRSAGTHEHYVYPFSLELKERHPLEYRDVDLTEIIKATIGGEYVKKRMA
jgi:ABC-type multidrug transport system ATPase subunit